MIGYMSTFYTKGPIVKTYKFDGSSSFISKLEKEYPEERMSDEETNDITVTSRDV